MFLKLTKEQRQMMIADIQDFFLQERDEEITEFAAESVLNFFKESLAPHFYNAAIQDAKHVVEQQFLSLEEEIVTLERPVRK
ncbi:hypothetical protein AN964_21425 [Heyndrickxia shackletonii]|uniref:DUF2164 domain-containing protein n=1 Tax=Heyndrickxia shackletonii TaxID=157838 RepID=A0A0Q3WT67_9BACI|nr:DUF2164 domain-containing protein [Heyndrickxia shackletonii]KQL51517.1 hypothetical protein AN964_21425 [Heyndrickxia shackletonii]MBB2482326.1 DUF2164 domain-containing protein [Bacillus sp. APMAM]NEZ02514.1 DUF2164 domain-containing protein [Heyndrickxia shackletonii]RTZ54314.1 DUF2164 domain-containing protein [Bacillus sp. SAJ1]